MMGWAGQESTEEFARYHRNAEQCIQDYDYLRLGRVVEETTPDQLANYEVALNGMVYDLRRESPALPHPLFHTRCFPSSATIADKPNCTALWDWDQLPEDHPIFTGGVGDGYGTDISHRLRVPQPSDGLLQLLNRRDLIVAKLSTVVDVYADELAENDGSVAPPEDDDNDRSGSAPRPAPAPERRPVWVSCGVEVYDMTCKLNPPPTHSTEGANLNTKSRVEVRPSRREGVARPVERKTGPPERLHTAPGAGLPLPHLREADVGLPHAAATYEAAGR